MKCLARQNFHDFAPCFTIERIWPAGILLKFLPTDFKWDTPVLIVTRCPFALKYWHVVLTSCRITDAHKGCFQIKIWRRKRFLKLFGYGTFVSCCLEHYRLREISCHIEWHGTDHLGVCQKNNCAKTPKISRRWTKGRSWCLERSWRCCEKKKKTEGK